MVLRSLSIDHFSAPSRLNHRKQAFGCTQRVLEWLLTGDRSPYGNRQCLSERLKTLRSKAPVCDQSLPFAIWDTAHSHIGPEIKTSHTRVWSFGGELCWKYWQGDTDWGRISAFYETMEVCTCLSLGGHLPSVYYIWNWFWSAVDGAIVRQR